MNIKDSVAWSAGQQYERNRIGELLRQRVRDLRAIQAYIPPRTIDLLTSEVQLLITAIEREPA